VTELNNAAVEDARHGFLDEIERNDEPFFRHDGPTEHDLNLEIGVRQELVEQLLKFTGG